MGIEEFLLERARNEGIAIGEKRAEKRREKKVVYSIVQNLLKRGMSLEEVSEITTFSIEEVTLIADKLKKGRI
ncbi:MAG: hypothetical protein ACFCUU_07935 [Cyclobacteriaceae bacterium]